MKETLKKILPDILVILLFAVISFAYFFPAVTEGRVLTQHDIIAGIGAGQEALEYHEKPENVPVGPILFSVVCLPINYLPATTLPIP